MKKYLICIAFTLAISIGLGSFLSATRGTTNTSCLSNPLKNNGTCLPRAEGNGFSCVVVGTMPINCYGTIEDPSVPTE